MVKPKNISPATANRLTRMSSDVLEIASRCRELGWDTFADELTLLGTKLETISESLDDRIGGQTHYLAEDKHLAELKHPERSVYGRK